MIAIIANRGQYNHRIYRTLKYLGAESKLIKNSITVSELRGLDLSAIIIGGGPFLNESGNSLSIIKDFKARMPILGICLGHQLLAKAFRGEVCEAPIGEYAEAEINVEKENRILKGLGPSFNAWVSHKDEITRLPDDFVTLASSETCQIEAMSHKKLPIFGVQFHPEVEHTPKGPEIFKNFLNEIK